MTAIDVLAANLKYYNIPFDMAKCFDGYVIKYPSIENQKLSVAFHSFSYGYSSDLLECMGLNYNTKEEKDEDVIGFCSPSYVLIKILQYEHCKSKKGFVNERIL